MKTVAYLGDTGAPGPASYLQGIMTHYKIPFLYVPSDTPPPVEIFGDSVGLYILSDYPSATFSDEQMERLCARVREGAGLLMFGGWESYHGLGGDYDKTPLAELLPVEILPGDDRRNWAQTIVVRAPVSHPIIEGLPFETPPCIGGYNEFKEKPQAQAVLEGEIYEIRRQGANSTFSRLKRFPLLVSMCTPGVSGRRACLATDVAPHWVGGFVDWGNKRLTVQMDGDFIEVGCWYAEFFRNLVLWCLGAE